MIRSMTGFGDASCERDGVHYAVELRSLNNRYYKSNIRLPDSLSLLEAELDPLLRSRLVRGTINLTIDVLDRSAGAQYDLNEELLTRYIQQLRKIEHCAGELDPAQAGIRIELGSLLGLPGVIQPPNNQQLLEMARPVILDLTLRACDALNVMRQREGAALVADLLSHKAAIASRLAVIRERAPLVVEEYHQRLRNRVEDLLARAKLEVERVDLIREVAIFAERCDISEEIQRLTAHLDQFEEILNRKTEEGSGRTLDFLAQELLREANTISSKSNDAEIARQIVEVKGAIDRIKEQVQNVE